MKKSQDGFSLVETMVVVAIVALLAAVAIPNFKHYQAKAKLTEAKLQLAAAYTAEQTFFSTYNLYGSCLTYMGYDPAADAPSRYFAIGFVNPVPIDPATYSAAEKSGLSSAGCPRDGWMVLGSSNPAVASTPDANQFLAGKGIGNSFANSVLFLPANMQIGDQSDPTKTVFTLGAGGVISENHTSSGIGQGSAAKLSINNEKTITIIEPGY